MQTFVILTTVSKGEQFYRPTGVTPRIMDVTNSPRESRIAVKKIVDDFKAYGDEYKILYNETIGQARIENEHEIVFVKAVGARIRLSMSID